MRKGMLVASLMLVLMMGMSMVRADEKHTPKPGTAEDNECYPGGVLYREENQDGCPTLWYWKAGWFLARFNQGLISRQDFPKEFASVLPPLNEEKIITICGTNTDLSDEWYGCINSDQTGFERVGGDFFDYLLLVNDKSQCPSSFNGVPFTDSNPTQTYMIDFYLFTPAQIASIGGVRPVTCIYIKPKGRGMD